MKDSRRSSSTYSESLFLHVVKHNLFFLRFGFFSIWLFFPEYSQFTGQQVKRGAISLYRFYHFHLLHRHLDISWVIAAQSSPLGITGSWNQTWNLWYTLFRIYPFYTCTGSCCWRMLARRMLKTQVTLGNDSHILLNLTKRLIFAMFKVSSSLPMFTQLTVIFSLQFMNYSCFSS